jgi:hypothetical protein
MADTKFGKVMKEFYAGDLKSGSGKKVTNPEQAKAIAAAESNAVKMAAGGAVCRPTGQGYRSARPRKGIMS